MRLPSLPRMIGFGLLLLLALGGCWLFADRYQQAARAELFADARDESTSQARASLRLLESELQKFRLIPVVLSEYPDLRHALQVGAVDPALNDKLASLAAKTGAAAIFVLDHKGLTIAASNARQSDSFVGQDYAFRPYYQLGWQKGGGEYFALGTVSRRPGLYLSRRVEAAGRPIGVIVVKVEFDEIERAWASRRAWTFVADQNGVLLLSSIPGRRFQALRPIDPARRTSIQQALQFGSAPLTPIGLTIGRDGRGHMPDGAEAMTASLAVPVPGWRLYHVSAIDDALAAVRQRARIATLLFASVLAMTIGALLWMLARRRRAARDRVRLQREVALRTQALDQEMEARTIADRRYRQAREELAHANRLGTLGTISAGVAHEINQPVATIRTFAENAAIFLDRAQPAKVDANLREIVAMTDRIGSITAQLRRYARRGVGEIGPIPLGEVMDGVRLLVGDRFRSAGVTLTLPTPAASLRVRAGRIRLEQVLVNLLHNALEAVADQPDGRTSVTLVDKGDVIHLDVRDNGPGIADSLRDDLFMPFATSKPGGLGLGLHIARDIMVEFGGSLDHVAGTPETLFRILLVKA